MVYRRTSKLPMRFHVTGLEQPVQPYIQNTYNSIAPIKRFTMFQNLQNIKPCGSCGMR